MNLLFTALLIGAVYASARKLGGSVQRGSRAEAEAWLQNYEKEQGYLPYSPAELAQMETEERANHNSNARSIAFWTGSKTYVDYDGKVRQL